MTIPHDNNIVDSLPAFTGRGTLPPGIHTVTWREFQRRFGYNSRRRELIRGLRRACRWLRKAGCRSIFIGGSFVTSKPLPGDIDVCWSSSETDWRRLARIAPVFFEMTPGSPRQKRRFGGEFFPAEGIETLSNKTFLEFFQQDQGERPTGIVRLHLRSKR